MLRNWDFKEDYKTWERDQISLLRKSTLKDLRKEKLTHELTFQRSGSRVDFRLNGELYLSTEGELLLNPEVFRLYHDERFWRKLLKVSKRIN